MELERLSRDHHLALVVAKKTRQAADVGASNQQVAEVWLEIQNDYRKEMELHFGLEETILLPVLDAAGLDTHVERVLFEHKQMRNILAQDVMAPVEMREFSMLLKSHVRFEERELFSAAEELLSEAALKEIQHKLEAA